MEDNLDRQTKAAIIGKRVEKMQAIVDDARIIRKAFSEVTRGSLSEVPGMDEVFMASGLAKTSDVFFEDFENTLNSMSSLCESSTDEIDHLDLVEAFIVFISELKPRSLRHLATFLAAATDGEWIDGLFIAHGKDSEFRCIDQCSAEARKEFGLTK